MSAGDEFVEGAEGPDLLDPTAMDAAQQQIKDIRDKNVKEAQAGLRSLQESYRRVFLTQSADIAAVLADLEQFCRADQTPFHPDERIHCVLTGRHEVISRIREYTRLDFDTLWRNRTQPQQ